jgi:molybdopterin synthase sulfur carrier subunit
MAKIHLASPLRSCTEGIAEVNVNAVTIREALDSLIWKYPRLRLQLNDNAGNVRNFVGIFLNGVDMRMLDGGASQVAENDSIEILLAVAGG